jgi:hypothetical protein
MQGGGADDIESLGTCVTVKSHDRGNNSSCIVKAALAEQPSPSTLMS